MILLLALLPVAAGHGEQPPTHLPGHLHFLDPALDGCLDSLSAGARCRFSLHQWEGSLILRQGGGQDLTSEIEICSDMPALESQI